MKTLTPDFINKPGSVSVAFNPAVVGLGWLARYSIDVLPSSFPDSDIVWSIAQGTGNVVFIGGNTGRSVVVRGNAEGDFKLEVTIGNPIAPLSPKPYILGKVLTETVTPLHFFIITLNGIPSLAANKVAAEAKIDLWVANANHKGRQLAMSFTKASVTYLERPEWFNITNDAHYAEMFSYTNNVGGLEIYCVNTLDTPATLGVSSVQNPFSSPEPDWGIALAAHAWDTTLMHEILHACGLEDITTRLLGTELVSEYLVGADNWSGGAGTGYYPSDLTHSNLVNRLVMCQGSNERGDIPFGEVRGWGLNEYPQSDHSRPSFKLVGFHPSRMNRNPRH